MEYYQYLAIKVTNCWYKQQHEIIANLCSVKEAKGYGLMMVKMRNNLWRKNSEEEFPVGGEDTLFL